MSTISVIIPVRNRKELLATTLRNILAQTRPPDEIIVVNDHSTDDTAEFVRDTFGTSVTLILSEGRGPGAARNTGFRKSTGDYIKFFDSDDLLTNNTLEVQSAILNQGRNQGVYSPCFHAQSVSAEEWKLTDPAILQYHPAPSSRPLRWWMFRGLFVMIPAFLFRRQILEKAGPWRTDITTYEDWDLLWRLAGLEPVPAHTNQCAFLYRMHGIQTMGTTLDSSRRDYEKVLCFTDILRADREGDTAGRLFFETMIADTLRKNHAEEWTKQFPIDYDRLKYRMLSKLLIAKNKAGRIRTGTNWQPMHGAVADIGQIRTYLGLMNPAYRLVSI